MAASLAPITVAISGVVSRPAKRSVSSSRDSALSPTNSSRRRTNDSSSTIQAAGSSDAAGWSAAGTRSQGTVGRRRRWKSTATLRAMRNSQAPKVTSLSR